MISEHTSDTATLTSTAHHCCLGSDEKEDTDVPRVLTMNDDEMTGAVKKREDESQFDFRQWISQVCRENDIDGDTTLTYYGLFIDNEINNDNFKDYLPYLDRDLLFKLGIKNIRHLIVFEQSISKLQRKFRDERLVSKLKHIKESQSSTVESSDEFVFENKLTIDEARSMMAKFVRDRDWNQFHTPRNILIALVGEIGELCELFQWKGEVTTGIPEFKKPKEIDNLHDELADVLAYLVRLSDVCHVDLAQAFTNKMHKNDLKYPKDLVRGSSKKYTEY